MFNLIMDSKLSRIFTIIFASLISVLYFSSNSTVVHASEMEVSFQDNFSDPNWEQRWEVVRGNNNSWHVEDGKLIANIYTRNTISEIKPLDLKPYGDFILEYDIRASGGIDSNFTFKFIDLDSWTEIHHTVDRQGFSVFNLEQLNNTQYENLGSFYARYGDLIVGINRNRDVHVKTSYIDERLTFCFKIIGDIRFPEVICPINEVKVDTLDNIKGIFTLKAGTGPNSFISVKYDNVILTVLSDEAGLNLPFDYTNRLENDNDANFRDAFNSRLTSAFDHNPEKFEFTNYLGDKYVFPDCQKANLNDHNLDCYDAHRGYDFDNIIDSESVYPVYAGEVVYASDDCKLENKGYGCNVIIKHDLEGETIYSLYGHLDELNVTESDIVSEETEIGKMGSTGYSSGVHLHLSIMKPGIENTIGLNSFKSMSRENWKNLVQSEVDKEKKDKSDMFKPRESVCYHDESEFRFYFIDPSGWNSDDVDPWEETCGFENKYLWRYQLN